MIQEGQTRGAGPKSKVYCVDGPSNFDLCQEFRYSRGDELNKMVREWHADVATQKREYLRTRTRWQQFRDWLRKPSHRIRIDAFGWRCETIFSLSLKIKTEEVPRKG